MIELSWQCMLLLFKTMVELFGYPGKECWQWREFIENHKEVMTKDEYNTAIRWLSVGLEDFLIYLDPESK